MRTELCIFCTLKTVISCADDSPCTNFRCIGWFGTLCTNFCWYIHLLGYPFCCKTFINASSVKNWFLLLWRTKCSNEKLTFPYRKIHAVEKLLRSNDTRQSNLKTSIPPEMEIKNNKWLFSYDLAPILFESLSALYLLHQRKWKKEKGNW
jgi:hypothetical protein